MSRTTPGARALLEESLTVYSDPGYAEIRANVVHVLGLVAEDLGDDRFARSLYRESLMASTQVGDRSNIASNLEIFAALAAKANQPVRALRLLGATTRLREEMSSPVPPTRRARCAWTLETARGQLSSEVAATALTEGRTMTWQEASAYALGDDEVETRPA